LEEAIQLSDDSKQYFSFSGEVFKCNGYFSKDKIFEEVKPNLWWINISWFSSSSNIYNSA
jgi:hypothetical protein